MFNRFKKTVRETFPVAHLAYHVWRKPNDSWEIFEKHSIINHYEKRRFSQHGEDGILQYLLNTLDITNGYFLEFGFSVNQCNLLSLMLHNDFDGTFIDANNKTVDLFNKAARLKNFKSKAVYSFLNVENLPSIVSKNIRRPIDVLSIDVDGNDYWFWKALDCTPAVVVIEYNATLGTDKSITIPYDPEFDRHEKHSSGFYAGASLTAMQKLGNEKGYALVGCDSWGVNAFFVRRDLLREELKEVTPAEAFYPHNNRLLRDYDQSRQWAEIQHLDYEIV